MSILPLRFHKRFLKLVQFTERALPPAAGAVCAGSCICYIALLPSYVGVAGRHTISHDLVKTKNYKCIRNYGK